MKIQHGGFKSCDFIILIEIWLIYQAPTIPKPKPSSSKPVPKPKSLNRLRDKTRESSSAFGNSKKDKRSIKRSALLSRIEKPKPVSKKRRPRSKTLITSLESLANALPEISNDQSEKTVLGNARIQHRSLKSKPGATKKKELLITLESERFNKNMAQMIALPNGKDKMIRSDEDSIAPGSVERKWAAIRNFIEQNMEHRPHPEVVNPTR